MDNQEKKTKEKAMLGWNWGAFTLPLLFGAGNKTNQCFLILIPFFNLAWAFVCGFKGTSWSFESGEFDSVNAFNSTMKSWNRAGIFAFVLILSITIITSICAVVLGTSLYSVFQEAMGISPPAEVESFNY